MLCEYIVPMIVVGILSVDSRDIFSRLFVFRLRLAFILAEFKKILYVRISNLIILIMVVIPVD